MSAVGQALEHRYRRVTPIAIAERVRRRISAREERRLLHQVRDGRDVCWLEGDSESEPLVTIRIATYNRGDLVVERAITSALRQSYEHVEVVVVGDRCDEKTERAVRSVTDARLRFLNLPSRGIYPSDPRKRWLVAGVHPANVGTDLARGAWICPCDDDDEITPDHVEVLLGAAKQRRLEMVYSQARCEVAPGVWKTIGSEPLRFGHVSHGSVMYSAGLRFMRYGVTAWHQDLPADWDLWHRMQRAGVRTGFVDQCTYIHFLETPQRPAMESSRD
jgi:hypothetical protein